ncbi:MAG: ECF transporter S component [Clostridium sp.]|nr:ECF transporter S component [Clostridium sp.]
MTNVSKKTNILVKSALLLTIGFILTYFELPVMPAFPWLKVDLSAVPVLLTGFAFGPIPALGVEFFKNFLVFTIKGSSTGGVGQIANFAIVGTFVFVASLTFMRQRTKKSAIIGVILGTIAMIPVAVLINVYVLVPLLFPGGLEAELYRKYITYGIPMFNLIKGSLLSVTGIFFYSKVSFLIDKESGFRSKKNSLRQKESRI